MDVLNKSYSMGKVFVSITTSKKKSDILACMPKVNDPEPVTLGTAVMIISTVVELS